MSRAINIEVSESCSQTLTTGDEVVLKVPTLEIGSRERTTDLLKEELKENHGFEEGPEGTLTKRKGDIVITANPETREVSAKIDVTKDVSLEKTKTIQGWDDAPNEERTAAAKNDLKRELEAEAEAQTKALQREATKALEDLIPGLQRDMQQAAKEVSKKTVAEVAHSLGTVTETVEADGNVKITIEV